MIVMAFALSFAAMGQCGSTAVLSGCVGACGASYSASYTVTPSDVGPYGVATFCLAATSNSLCPSHNAYATLRKNNNRAINGNLDEGDVLSLKAVVGDVLYVTVDAVEVNDIQCVWLGETHFSLTR